MDRNLRIRMLLEAGDRVTKPLRDITQGAGRAGRELKQTRDRLKEIGKERAGIARFRELKTEIEQTRPSLEAARTRVAGLGRELNTTSKPTKALTRDFRLAKTEAEQLEQKLQVAASGVNKMRDEARKAGKDLSGFASDEVKLRNEATKLNHTLKEQEERFQRVTERQKRMGAARESFARTQGTATGMVASGGAAVGIAAAAAAPVVASARAAMSLEEGMAGVAKVTGLADARLAGMQNRLVDLSARIPMTAVELANIAASAGAAGVGMDKFGRPLKSQADDLVAFTDAAARMGIAFDMTAEDAGSTMAKWRQAFKMPQAEVEALGDRVNALTNKFGGKADQVSDIITRIGPLGEVAGLAAPEIAALGSSLNSIGVENEIAATGIKNTLLTLTKGTAATKSQKKAFDELSLSATDVAKRMQSNASGTIVDVLERIGRIKPEGQAAILSELFGTESVGAIAPLLTNLDGLKQRLGLVGDRSKYAGSMTGEFLSRINTTTGATDLAANALQSVNITLGQALLPNIKAGAQWLGRVAGRTRRWAEAHPVLAKGIMGAVIAGAALFALVGVGMIVLAAFMAPLAIINAGLIAMGVSGGVASLGLMPILGTVALVVGVIGLFAGAAYLVYSNWGAISGWFGSLWNGIKAAFSGGIVGILGMWLGWHAEMLGMLWNFSGKAYGWLIGTLPGLLGHGIMAALKFMGNTTVAVLTTLAGTFFNFGVNIVRGLINGILSAPAALANAAGSLASTVIQRFRKGADIHSPSRVFMRLGGYVVAGLTEGIEANEDDPARRIARIAGRMQDAASSKASRLPALTTEILSAMSVAVAAPAVAAPAIAAPAVAATGGGGAPPAAANSAAGPITINIYPQAGQNPQDIARAVRDALDAQRRQDAARARSSYADTPDWN